MGDAKWQYQHVKQVRQKKRARRMHQVIKAPNLSFDLASGEYRRSHLVSLKGYYKGQKVQEKE